jgi:hydroxymethylbilane synthase
VIHLRCDEHVPCLAWYDRIKLVAMTTRPAIRLGTRGSKLALAQTREVRERLVTACPELAAEGGVEIVVIRTTGDRIQDRTLSDVGGKGLFTKEIEEWLLAGSIDIAVHSVKDMETRLRNGMMIAAVLPREDPRDAFFSRLGSGLEGLPSGAIVGTASLRRQAQVLSKRTDIRVVPFRGNVDTRLRKLAQGEVDATILAVAGLKRLGAEDRIQAVLSAEDMLPAAGQGAIGLEVRVDDEHTRAKLAALNDPASERRVVAERACLVALDGSCRTPIAALAELEEDSLRLRLRALVAMPDGSQVYRVERCGPVTDAERLGRDAGVELRAAAGREFFARPGGD